MDSKTNIVYKASETETIRGFWNGKNYGGEIYINPEILGEIMWRKSVKVKYDLTKMFAPKKEEKSSLPTNTANWMKLMANSER